MDVVVIVAEFKNRLKALGYAKKTIESYIWGLDAFAAHLKSIGIDDLRKVTHQVLIDYQVMVSDQGLAMESKAIKIRPVKRLFEYLTRTHQLLINPAEGIVETCRVNRKIGTVLTLNEMKSLLSRPNLSLPIEIRDRAIMALLYATGIRIDELENLTIHDADLSDQVLFIRKAKGRKQRVVPLGTDAATYLTEYLKKIRPRYAAKNHQSRALFLSVTGLPITADSVRQLLKKYRKQAGIKKPVTPHTFRRTCATHMLQSGADIRYIQKLLGHTRLRITQSYTKVLPVEVKKTHKKTHPGVTPKKDKKEEDQ